MSEQGMKILVERNLLPALTKVSLPLCEHCVISKQHRLKYKTSNSRSVSVLELVHSDVWQAPVQSLGGEKYFVFFIDDYSRRCWVYLIKKKSSVFEVFKVRRNQKAVHNNIHCSTEWSGRTDEQNFVRKSKSNVGNCKRGKIILGGSSYTACYVINRSPSTTIELKTPMEMWTGKPVNYFDLHIFGNLVYVMYNSQETTKLDPRSIKCLFLGYADGVKGYRLWDLVAYKVVVSRYVVFIKDKIQENEEGWHSDYVMESNVAYCLLTEEGKPSTLQEALNRSSS
ncbi:gag-pol polyprotein [Tanacetum coccineum]